MTVPDHWRNHQNNEEQRKFDRFAHAVTVISEPHRMGHDGFMFHVSGPAVSVVDTAILDHLLIVPAFTYPHLNRIRATVGKGDCTVQLYESTTVSDNGDLVTPRNTNRNSSNTPSTLLLSDPTVTGVGDLLHTTWIPPTATGVGQTADGVSNAEFGEEWVLKPSTNYLIRITNNSGVTIDVDLELLWYEIGYDL
jgi:hypothetical protein